MKRFLFAVDGFYSNPDLIRERAQAMNYEEPEDYVGWRTKPFFPPGIKERIERVIGRRITRWPDDPDDSELGNGSFFFGLSAGRLAEPVGVHFDTPTHYVTAVIYLTPSAPLAAGTSLWRHRTTGLCAAPTAADVRRLHASVAELVATLVGDSTDRRKWIEIDRIGNIYNRAVFYRSGLLHSATRHFGSNVRNGRLYQTFRFGIGRA